MTLKSEKTDEMVFSVFLRSKFDMEIWLEKWKNVRFFCLEMVQNDPKGSPVPYRHVELQFDSPFRHRKAQKSTKVEQIQKLLLKKASSVITVPGIWNLFWIQIARLSDSYELGKFEILRNWLGPLVTPCENSSYILFNLFEF